MTVQGLGACRLCDRSGLVDVPSYAQLPRVTSDCRPWPSGGHIASCSACGCIQKVVDPHVRDELAAIYSGYTMYAQAGGNEQRAFDASSGTLDPRSRKILAGFLATAQLGATGGWLDIGCGNGAMLKAASQALPQWRLVGAELDDRNRATVESIPGVERLHAGPLDTLSDAFDVISMVHVLEHIEDPIGFLQSLQRLMKPGGVVFVEVPLSTGNYFDLSIADHVTHFDEASLRLCFERAGFLATQTGRAFLDREFFMSARLPDDALRQAQGDRAQAQGDTGVRLSLSKSEPVELAARVEWLSQVAGHIATRGGGGFGIFGSSIGATFAYAARGGDVDFFLDEDPDRIGHEHLGVPILAPHDAPAGAAVFVPLPPQLARIVTARPERAGWLVPPPYPSSPVGIASRG
jgi:SAM-dependent methyltransferase